MLRLNSVHRVKRVSVRTSYFANYKKDNGVSIARITPKWFKGEELKILAPSKDLLFKYKNKECSKEDFTREFKAYLDSINVQEVYKLVRGKVLLCYEKKGDFCHRRIVAEWLEDNLRIKVREI